MPLPELLDELFRLYRRHFQLIVGVSLIVVLPGLIWSLITGGYRFGLGSYTNIFPTPGTTSPSLSSQQVQQLIGASILGAIGTLLLSPFAIGAVYRAVADVAQGRPATIGSVLRETLARYLPLLALVAIFIGLVIVFAIALVIGAVLLVLPALIVFALGIYLAVRWSLTVAAMMAEDLGPVTGMRRSWALVAGTWWRTLGVLFILGILQGVIGYGLGLLFGGIAALLTSGDVRLALVQIVTTLVSAVISPIMTIGIMLLYFDLRVRKEGLDLDQLARDAGPAAGTAPA